MPICIELEEKDWIYGKDKKKEERREARNMEKEGKTTIHWDMPTKEKYKEITEQIG